MLNQGKREQIVPKHIPPDIFLTFEQDGSRFQHSDGRVRLSQYPARKKGVEFAFLEEICSLGITREKPYDGF